MTEGAFGRLRSWGRVGHLLSLPDRPHDASTRRSAVARVALPLGEIAEARTAVLGRARQPPQALLAVDLDRLVVVLRGVVAGECLCRVLLPQLSLVVIDQVDEVGGTEVILPIGGLELEGSNWGRRVAGERRLIAEHSPRPNPQEVAMRAIDRAKCRDERKIPPAEAARQRGGVPEGQWHTLPVAGLVAARDADQPAPMPARIGPVPVPVQVLRRYADPAGPRFSVGPAADPQEVAAERAADRLGVLRLASATGGSTAAAEVGGAGGALSESTSRTVEALLDRGNRLPPGLRSTMESSFGADFGAVRLHTGGVAARLNTAMGAHAFTVDRTIFYGGPATDLQTDRGRHILGHELAHVLQNRAAGGGDGGEGTGRRLPIRRFGVSLRFEDDPAIPDARVTGLTFTGRPGDTFIGGDPYGTRRHLVSWTLEQQAHQALVAHKTMRELADHYGGPGSRATKQHVEAAIKAQIAGEREHRKVHQGSAEGNQALGLMEQQGKTQLARPGLSEQEYFRAHVMAFLGAIDMPSGRFDDARQNKALLDHTVARASNFYVVANGITHLRQLLVDAATAALWDSHAGRYRSGDDIGGAFRPTVMAAQYRLPPTAAGMMGQFTMPPPQGAQQLTGASMGTLTWHHH